MYSLSEKCVNFLYINSYRKVIMSSVEYVLKSDYDDLLKTVKKLQKQVKKVLKTIKMQDVDETKPKKLSGFAKPTSVSEDLASFLGIEKDVLIARTEVTKRINTYVKENGLQNQENKRIIVLDDTLRKLVSLPDDVELTFFNLQKYLKHHYTSFKKSEPVEPEPVEPEPVESESPKTKKVVKKKVKK